MQHRGIRLLAVLAVGALVLGACGSDDSGSAAGDTTTAPAETTTSAPAAAGPTGTATPSEGLHDGDVVKVEVSGFTPGLTVGINECSTETDDTGSGCDLGGIGLMDIGDDGTASADFTVKVGPFGADDVVCTDPGTQCILSVGELAAGDVERSGDIELSFAG
jgi:hypothetical protein